jgi:hypothetical protein
MQTEQTLQALFFDYRAAEDCQRALRAIGLDVVQIRSHRSLSPGRDAQAPTAPTVEWGRFGYQPDLTDDKWTSAAQWDEAVEPWLLTALVPTEQASQARAVIARYGGQW